MIATAVPVIVAPAAAPPTVVPTTMPVPEDEATSSKFVQFAN